MRWLSACVAIILLFATGTVVAAEGNSVTINLPAANNSGESGTVSLTQSGSSLTEMLIVLHNQPILQTQYQNVGGQQVINPSTYGGAVPQLAGIYSGTCDNPTPTTPPNLGATTPNGPNVTGNGWFVIKMPVSQVLAGNYVVAVHKDGTDTSPLVACAALTAGAEQAASSATSASSQSSATSASNQSSTTASASTTAQPTASNLPKTGTPGAFFGLMASGGLLLVGLGIGLRRRAADIDPSEISGDSQTKTEEVRK